MSERNSETEVRFKPIFWDVVDAEGDFYQKCQIHVSGLMEDGRKVYGIFENFCPYVFIELKPSTGINNAVKARKLMDTLKTIISKRMETDIPLEYTLVKKKTIHYSRDILAIKCFLPSQKACQTLVGICHGRYPIKVVDNLEDRTFITYEPGSFVVHESQVEPLIKFMSISKIQPSNWVSVDISDSEESNFSHCDIDFRVDWKSIKKAESKTHVYPTYLSFDLETYSHNHNSKNPDGKILENEVFIIGVTSGKIGDEKEERRRVLLTLFDPHDLPGIEIRRFKTEKDLILGFVDLVNEINPDIFYGYNIMRFDWHYLLDRAHLGTIPKKEHGLGWGADFEDRFLSFSRLRNDIAQIRKFSWSSSAYGLQEGTYPMAHGRINLDLNLEVERGFKKFPSYKLDAIASYYLGETKDPVTHVQIFMLYYLTKHLLPSAMKLPDYSGNVPPVMRKIFKKKITKILLKRKCSGPVLELRTRLLKFGTKAELISLIREGMTILNKYCSKDCELPIDLGNKLNVYLSSSEMSNITGVPISYLILRGQQIKVLSQVYRDVHDKGFVITFKKKLDDKDIELMEGARVQKPYAGFHENPATLDFNSLYPSIIIAANLCWTTFVQYEDKSVSDEECEIFIVSEHSGCEHDPSHRRKKKELTICKDHRYRFIKVEVLPDGTRRREGILPKICRQLLDERKIVKGELAKAQALYDTATGKATKEEIEGYISRKWKIAKPGELSPQELKELKTDIIVLDAKQNNLKISANSAYGTLCAQRGPLPMLPAGRTVTFMGRKLITEAIDFILRENPGDETGKGKACLVYGDTDSCMIKYLGLDTIESFKKGDEMAYRTSVYLKCFILNIPFDWRGECVVVSTSPEGKPVREKKTFTIDKFPRTPEAMSQLSDRDRIYIHSYNASPINLAMENLYKIMFLLSKKRYITQIVNREGKLTGGSNKGVVLTRRDNSKFLKDTYKAVVDVIMNYGSREDAMFALNKHINMLFWRLYPYTSFIIYIGVKDVFSYAAKRIVVNKIEVGRHFYDKNGKEFEKPDSPLDDRLVYRTTPQASVALKILRRGDQLPPNTRLEIVYLENPHAQTPSEKAEEFEYFNENRGYDKSLKIDYFHYIEKQLVTPITELFVTRWPPEIVPWEDLQEKVQRLMDSLNMLHLKVLRGVKTYEKSDSCSSGSRVLQFEGIYAKIEKVLELYRSFSPKKPNEGIDRTTYPELYDACLQLKSRNILTRLYEQHSIPKKFHRKADRPTRIGDKLLVSTVAAGPTQVYLLKDVVDVNGIIHKAGKIANLSNIHIEEITSPDAKKRKQLEYYYDLNFDTALAVHVPRRYFTTFYYKEGKFMEKILKYRVDYKELIDSIPLKVKIYTN